MNLKELTLEGLKAIVYDCLVETRKLENIINQVNTEISARPPVSTLQPIPTEGKKEGKK